MEKIRFSYEKVDKDALIEELFSDPLLKRFFLAHDLDATTVEEHLISFLRYRDEKQICEACNGLNECKLDTIGMTPSLKFINGDVRLYYQDCHFMEHQRSLTKQDDLIDALYMPKAIKDASLEDYRTNSSNRMDIYRAMMKFINEFSRGDDVKGMYLYGEYQQGKTYSLGALANALIKKGYHVMIAYYPDLVREFKSSIRDNSLSGIVSKLKTVDVLMLDDIGGEAHSAWVRDEILGPILQHRLLDQKPTFFTSNVARKELGAYMVENEQKAEKMKAFRIIARILSLTEEFKM
jgi:primosomal protein DnaI